MARDRQPKVLQEIEEFFESGESELPNDGGYREQHTGLTRVGSKSYINWDLIRRDYILGKRKQLEDGTWVSEDYTYKELQIKYKLKSYGTLCNRAAKDGWVKLRKAYLARVNQQNIGRELGLYTTENFQAEVTSINICNKLAILADKYIEDKYGSILSNTYIEENIEDNNKEEEELPFIHIKDLRESIGVIKEIYELQRKIYENAPKGDDLVDEISQKRQHRNKDQRRKQIESLTSKLQIALNQKEKETNENSTG